MRFRTTLLQMGNNVGIEVPQHVIDGLGAGKKPAVTVDVNGTYNYRSTIAVMGGKYLISFNAGHRAASGFGGGDDVEVTLEVDTAPRVIDVPEVIR